MNAPLHPATHGPRQVGAVAEDALVTLFLKLPPPQQVEALRALIRGQR